MGSVPSELDWSFPAKEMKEFYPKLISNKAFRDAPYWKYHQVLQETDLEGTSLFAQTEPYGMCTFIYI